MIRYCKITIIVVACAFVAVPQVGCSTKAGTGAVVGGAGGAGLGAIIGHQSGHAGAGAVIGGAAGAIGGGLVGNGMDKADEKKAREQREREQYEARQQSTYAKAPPPAAPPPARTTPASTITRGDVVDWTRQGVKDEIIIDRIQRSGQKFVMTAADERELSSLGVSANVITAMKNTSVTR
jgi:uncharacterized protein YcfJ